jgi:hypothetical protein
MTDEVTWVEVLKTETHDKRIKLGKNYKQGDFVKVFPKPIICSMVNLDEEEIKYVRCYQLVDHPDEGIPSELVILMSGRDEGKPK